MNSPTSNVILSPALAEKAHDLICEVVGAWNSGSLVTEEVRGAVRQWLWDVADHDQEQRLRPLEPPANPMGRDADWVLAIGHALGLDSGYKVPIVPKPEVFRELFDEVRRRASQPPTGDQRIVEAAKAVAAVYKTGGVSAMVATVEALIAEVDRCALTKKEPTVEGALGEMRQRLGLPVETRAAPTWRCSICSLINPDDATHCRQCEYSRTIMRDGKRVPREGHR